MPTTDITQQFPTDVPIVAEMLSHFRECQARDQKIREDATRCHEFFVGGERQWADTVLAAYRAQERPDLTFNQLPQYVYSVLNEQLQNPGEVTFTAKTDSGASQDVARVKQDIARTIRTCQQGQYAIDHAYRDLIIGGFGYARLCTDYVSNTSTRQYIYIDPIESCFSVYFVGGTFPTYRDAEACILFHDMRKSEFEKKYPGKRMATIAGIDGNENEWIQKDSVRIAEYIKVETKKIKTVHLANGRRVPIEGYKMLEAAANSGFIDPVQPLTNKDGSLVTSEIEEREVWSHMLSCYEELEPASKWAGKYIPVIAFMGEQVIVNGTRYLKGLLNDSLDPQIAANFVQNEQLLNVAVSSKSPWLLAEGQMENAEDKWKTANRKAHSALTYKRYDDEGRDLGVPIRNNTEPPVQATQLVINSQKQSIMEATGIYPNMLGDQQSVNESGIAVIERRRQSKQSNFRFTSHLNIGQKWLGEQLDDLIPKVYDVPQIMELEGLDRKKYKAIIYNSDTQGQILSEQHVIDGVRGIFDLSKGDSDVSVSIGPGYENARQETQANLDALATAAPQLVPRFADIWVRTMDFAEKDELADRLMPPDIAMKGNNPAQMLPALQAKSQQQELMIQKLSQMVQQLTQEKQAQHDKIAGQIILEQLKGKNNKEVTQIQSASDLITDLTKLKSADAHKMLDLEINRIENDLQRQHDAGQSQQDQEFQKYMAIFNQQQQPAGSVQ